LNNTYNTMKYLFGDHLISYTPHEFSIDLSKNIHRQLMNNVDNTPPGQFRTGVVTALGDSTVTYNIPINIPGDMKILFDFIQTKRQENVENIEHQVKVAAFFMSEFLLIHPFEDGNGRTARILTNFLLRNITVVPFSLFYEKKEFYINALKHRNNRSVPPKALARFILRCMANWSESINEFL